MVTKTVLVCAKFFGHSFGTKFAHKTVYAQKITDFKKYWVQYWAQTFIRLVTLCQRVPVGAK